MWYRFSQQQPFDNLASSSSPSMVYQGASQGIKTDAAMFLSHNIMNYLQTTDLQYVQDAKQVIDKQLANSSLISVVNERERNNFFVDFEKTIGMFRKKIEADLDFLS
jgi:hypothetical protein